jgi:hypothetical protein
MVQTALKIGAKMGDVKMVDHLSRSFCPNGRVP